MASAFACAHAPAAPSCRLAAARAARSSLPDLPSETGVVLLPAKYRMRSSAEFRSATRRGRRVSSRTLVVHLHEGDVPSTHVGFVVGKQIGPAVARNRVRRKLRHLVADRMDSLPMGSRLVVRALAASGTASSQSLSCDLDRALARLAGRQ